MYAVFEAGGKQHQASVGDLINVEKIEAKVGDQVIFEHVLLIKEEGKEATVGRPYIAKATIETEVVNQLKDKKIRVSTFKHKGYHRTVGHRQPLTCVKIVKITTH